MDITINQDQLLNHFLAKCPTALTSKIIVDPKTQLSKGYGFVTFATHEEADRAIQLMDGSKLRGKAIKCRPSYIKSNGPPVPIKMSPEIEKETHSKQRHSKYPTYQNPQNPSLPTLGMGLGMTTAPQPTRRTSGFLAQQQEAAQVSNYQKMTLGATTSLPGMQMNVLPQQNYQQVVLQYQQVIF